MAEKTLNGKGGRGGRGGNTRHLSTIGNKTRKNIKKIPMAIKHFRRGENSTVPPMLYLCSKSHSRLPAKIFWVMTPKWTQKEKEEEEALAHSVCNNGAEEKERERGGEGKNEHLISEAGANNFLLAVYQFFLILEICRAAISPKKKRKKTHIFLCVLSAVPWHELLPFDLLSLPERRKKPFDKRSPQNVFSSRAKRLSDKSFPPSSFVELPHKRREEERRVECSKATSGDWPRTFFFNLTQRKSGCTRKLLCASSGLCL